MKYLSAIFILLCASFALGQGSYQAFPVVTANGLAIAGANVALCSTTLPTTATPCGGSTLEATYTDITLGTACALSPTILGPTYGIGCTNPGMADGLGMVRLYATANPNGTVYHYQTYGQGILVPDVEPIFFPGCGVARDHPMRGGGQCGESKCGILQRRAGGLIFLRNECVHRHLCGSHHGGHGQQHDPYSAGRLAWCSIIGDL